MSTIEQVRQAIIEHEANAWAKDLGYEPVFTAHPSAKIAIIGQAPGIRAQTSMLSWNDLSGDRLRQWMGIDRVAFYDPTQIALTAMDFYFPGSGDRGDLPPRTDFARLWHPHIYTLMPDIKLRILVGKYSQAYYLGSRQGRTLAETVRGYKQYLEDGFFPLPHPSPRNMLWLKKNPWFEQEVIPVFQQHVAAALL